MKVLAVLALLAWLLAMIGIAANPKKQSGRLPAGAVFFTNIALAVAVLLR